MVISENEQLCLARNHTPGIMAPSAVALPVRGGDNLASEVRGKAPKIIRQIDIEEGKTIAKVSL